ncbi:hypothetical protein [Loktanella salsilacus]|uniref:hypothetical protein n=1 Tax=Loktanella salsilacus TaxID=195913 RepID=UPI0037364907
MVESSKILTVSYGTFSCTLEGFEDSFSTMKAIAEYFRDLAAGDRYFGAEPPTPDAEMLTRIAEREISRRVDVRSSDTGIVLRASEPAAVPMQVATATPTPAAPAATADPAPAPAQAEAAKPDVADTAPMDTAPADDAPAPDAAEDDESPVMPPAPRRPVETDSMRVKAMAAARDAAPVEAVAQPAAPRAEPPAHPDSESVAAKLQRIRAVVGGVNPAAAPNAFVEDLEETAPVAGAPENPEVEAGAPVADDAPDADTSSAKVTADADLSQDDALPVDQDDAEPDTVETAASAPVAAEQSDDAPTAAAEEDETDDQIDAVLRNLQRAGLRAPQVEEPAAEVAADTPPAAPRGRILRVTRRQRPTDDAADAVATLTAADIAKLAAEKAAVAAPALPEQEKGTSAASTSVAALMAESQDAPQVAADEKPQGDTAADTIDDHGKADLSTDLLDADDSVDVDMPDVGCTLSEDDEADLQRTLAALRQEDDTDAAPQDAAPEQAKAPDADAAAPAQKLRRDPLPDTTEAEMSRIMSQANNELADPEASRRRNAIAQLKAAVAATEAARQLGETGDKRAETEDAFREDLDQVVRPRRAPRPEGTSDRGERARPAPLKLVPSQRVDLEKELAEAKSDGPVQPRRVATAAAAPAAEAGNFAEYAENMGATSLQDLLEAAAAYTAFVEGSEDFSRPHIMQKVRQTVSEDFSREDGLRSFGTLLRQGRIERVRNGRFAVSERIRFKPEARAVGS